MTVLKAILTVAAEQLVVAASGAVPASLLQRLLRSRDARGFTPLHWAALRGHAHCASLLLAQGAEKDVGDESGDSPLMLCSRARYHAVMLALLQAGAAPSVANNRGSTPLHAAVKNGDTAAVNILLQVIDKYVYCDCFFGG